MPITIVRDNPLIDAELMNPDVIVTYDKDTDRFFVTFVETNTGYIVNRGDLVSEDHKYTTRIFNEILAGCETDDDIDVVFTLRANNEIYIIWMSNCDLF